MNMLKNVALLVIAISVALTGVAGAHTDVNSDITVSETWTVANSPYHLRQQIYVTDGATLTIEEGVVIANYPPDQGSLAVTPGSQIFVEGTEANPVIMTSANDVANWDGTTGVVTNATGEVTAFDVMGDPKTGSWLERCNDWGNLTILGRGLISASHYDDLPVTYAEDMDGVAGGGDVVNHTNNKWPDGMSKKTMEGLVAGFTGDPRVLYGGDDDNDDSGSISYLSIRYGGKVIGLANELNGLSLGAIGRNTDIDHIEIMNNVDDGIEIWGGTVNLKYVSIWNIGDDSFDFDEGWRGKAQFGLIVQGYSIDAGQGSGVGDNCFEHDGAEDADAQPVTTTTIYNFTAVGQPIDGDHGTAWRDNARVQYRNCIFMNVGDDVIHFDDDDGDGANGYSGNESGSRTTSADGTLSWVETWTTAAGIHSIVNDASLASPGDFNHPDTLYTVQTSGRLAEMTDCVFYQNNDYSELDQLITDGALIDKNIASATPIADIQRGPLVSRGGKNMLPVTFIDPIPVGDALNNTGMANPAEGFWTAADFRGGFDPTRANWLAGWTAASAYGMTDGPGSAVEGYTEY